MVGSSRNVLNQTLLSYVPEVVWNEGSPTFGILAGGGGSSTHFPRPSWQAGVPGIPAGSFRLLPDVSLQSSVQSPGFIFCTTDPGVVGTTGGSSCNTLLGTAGTKGSIGGGTSFAAPVFAGFIATLNGLQGVQGQGLVNPTLYSLASQPATYASAFHDITSGSNACISGTPNCTPTGQSGFGAGQGFDEASGLGSIDFNNLVAAWPAPKADPREPTTFFLNNGLTAAPGTATLFFLGVDPAIFAPNKPTPTGTVAVSLDGNVLAAAAAFTGTASGSATLNFPYTTPTSIGSHVFTIVYSGDAVYAPTRATSVISVGNLQATGGLTLAATNLTLSNGTSGSTQVTITPNNGYNGRILWSLSLQAASTASAALSACYQLASPSVNGITTAALHLGVGAACGPSASGNAVLPTRIKAASLQHLPQSPFERKPLLATSAGLLCLLCLPRRRRRVPLLLVPAFLLLAGSSALTGCGGGSSQGSSPTPTPAPTSSVYNHYPQRARLRQHRHHRQHNLHLDRRLTHAGP